ncbi:MAG: hypothetical protein ACXAEU_25245 [Candidatus Hodarchaeales archaeon]|jgi:hypothetical protein
MLPLPYLALPSLIIVILLIAIALILVATSYWRHFHHYTYGVVFLIISVLYLIIYQFYQTEVVALIFFVTLPMGIIVILTDIKDFLLFSKSNKRKIKYCKHFKSCPCGCGFGTCKHEKITMVNGNTLAGDCIHYEMIENVHLNVKL